MSGGLRFDKMVDTEKAKDYMKCNEFFHSIGYSDTDQHEKDNCGNQIMLAQYERCIDLVTSSVWDDQGRVVVLAQKFIALAALVEENKLLFAQIDYMERKKSINETLNIDLKLIVQNMLYVSSAMTKKKYTSNVLAMRDVCPLSALGLVAQLVCAARHVVVESAPRTAVLCHLFVTLCRKAGLTVSLAFVKDPLPADVDYHQIKELQSGCMCVVTERSDVDAAVDILTASTAQDPWRIRRVLVQESVVQRLKQALEWKAKLNPSDNLPIFNEWSSAYRINDNFFVFEYTGHSVCCVIVEAYRTVKELLSLSNTHRPFAVSLWCADVAQANEIAYGIDSAVTWINDYGSFYGPSKSSQAFYSTIDVSYAKERIQHSFDVKRLCARRTTWMKLAPSTRCQLLNEAIGKAERSDVSKKIFIPAIDLNGLDGNCVQVTSFGICVGLEVQALPVVLFREVEIKHILNCLLKGFAVVASSLSDTLQILLSHLEEVGAPLVYKGVGWDDECLVTTQFSQHKLKVVRTSFGTIFAN